MTKTDSKPSEAENMRRRLCEALGWRPDHSGSTFGAIVRHIKDLHLLGWASMHEAIAVSPMRGACKLGDGSFAALYDRDNGPCAEVMLRSGRIVAARLEGQTWLIVYAKEIAEREASKIPPQEVPGHDGLVRPGTAVDTTDCPSNECQIRRMCTRPGSVGCQRPDHKTATPSHADYVRSLERAAEILDEAAARRIASLPLGVKAEPVSLIDNRIPLPTGPSACFAEARSAYDQSPNPRCADLNRAATALAGHPDPVPLLEKMGLLPDPATLPNIAPVRQHLEERRAAKPTPEQVAKGRANFERLCREHGFWEDGAPVPFAGPWCENCGDAFTGPERDCPKPAAGRPYKECGRGGHMFRLEHDPAQPAPTSDARTPEERIVDGVIERRAVPAFASILTPFVAPETLIEIARRSGEKIERIGGASVEIYTVLGWLRIYESKSLGPAEILFSFPPKAAP
jgi:hypothetical protein